MTPSLRILGLAGLVWAVLPTGPLSAADAWIEVKSPHFTVVANTSESKARNVAWQFEQVRSAIEKGLPWSDVQLDRPVLVIAAKDENTMRGLTPQFFEQRGMPRYASYLQTGADRHYVAIRADVQEEAQGLQPYRLAYWSYSEIVLGRTFRRGLPLWISRGTANVLSNTIVREKEIEFGRPLPYMANRVRAGVLLTVPRMIAVTHANWNALSADERQAYDAETWGLIQFLLFADPKARMNAISALVLEGVSSEDAIAQTFGSVEALDAAYRLYVHQGIFKFGKLPVNAQVPADKYPARVMSPAESAGVRSSFLAAENRPVEARALIAEARKLDPGLAAPYDAEATLASRENNREAERAALDKAVELNSASYYTHYRLATLMTMTATPESRAAARRHAERAVALNDRYAPALSFLANLLMQAGDDQAIAALVKAITIEPAELGYRIQLSNALVRFTRYEEAVKIARDALPFARSDAERARFQQAIDFATRAGAASGRGVPGP